MKPLRRMVLSLSPMIVAALVILGCASAQAVTLKNNVARPMLKDRNISNAIEGDLLLDRSVDGNNLEVETALGVVTIEGRVDNLLAKRRAVRIAEATKGVRAVIDRIEVAPRWNRADSDIKADAIQALMSDRATVDHDFGLAVAGGRVTLTGTVDSWREKKLADEIVAGVRGVRAVKNDVVVNVKLDRSDGEIAADVRDALKWDVRVDPGLIDVAVKGGVVRLSGTTGSLAEQVQAIEDAWVAGVHEVDSSGLKIQDWARDTHRRETSVVIKSDQQLVKAIKDALLFDPRVDSIDVEADSRIGLVTLRGTVPTISSKRAADEDARDTVGVLRVKDLIKVSPPESSDEDLEHHIMGAFFRDPYMDRYQIGVDVDGGVATLTGTVDSGFERARADDLVSRISGITRIKNELKVEDMRHPIVVDPYMWDYDPSLLGWSDLKSLHTWKTDHAIKEDIEHELWWSPLVPTDAVKVKVDDGVATLTGKVHSQFERRQATAEAYQGGAVWVDNKLAVTR